MLLLYVVVMSFLQNDPQQSANLAKKDEYSTIMTCFLSFVSVLLEALTKYYLHWI